MYRARSLVSAIVATLATAAALAGITWGGAELAARGTKLDALPTLLTTGSFAGLEWPYRTDKPPVSVHVAFYVAVAVAALAAGIVTLLATRKASPRNGASALFGTWIGAVLGSVIAAAAVYFIRKDALAATASERNELLASMLGRFAWGGLLIGLLAGLLSWVAFKLANRTRAAEYTEAMDRADGKNVDENPFDLTPGSIGDARPVEPGYTYPSGDDSHERSYRDADLPPSERRTGSMTFSDVTDATGEDFSDAPRAQERRAEPAPDLGFRSYPDATQDADLGREDAGLTSTREGLASSTETDGSTAVRRD